MKGVKNCISTHPQCKVKDESFHRFCPIRLLEIKITENAAIQLRLIEPTAEDWPREAEYTTLSHCWGSGEFTTLRSSNHDSLLEEVELSTLPKTFQDAVTVTCWLGVRHIWIDSLCILQDSADDWMKESASMKDVYKNSFCTIAATGASDSNGGCFMDRDPRAVHAFEVGINWLGPSSGQWPTKGVYTWCDASVISANVTYAPLTQGAWFVQERLLSPRVLHFGPQQMVWECQQMEACETFPDGIPQGMFSCGQKNIPAQKRDQSAFNKTWDTVIDSYTRCRLTMASDKSVALSGIVQELQASFQDCVAGYGGGIWQAICYGAFRTTLRYHQLLKNPLDRPPFEPRRGPGIRSRGLSAWV